MEKPEKYILSRSIFTATIEPWEARDIKFAIKALEKLLAVRTQEKDRTKGRRALV